MSGKPAANKMRIEQRLREIENEMQCKSIEHKQSADAGEDVQKHVFAEKIYAQVETEIGNIRKGVWEGTRVVSHSYTEASKTLETHKTLNSINYSEDEHSVYKYVSNTSRHLGQMEDSPDDVFGHLQAILLHTAIFMEELEED